MKKTNLYTFALIWLILLVFNLVFPPQSDDIAHYFSSQDEKFFASYLGWNGRFGELIWSGYFARFVYGFWFDFFNALIGATFIYAFFTLIFAHLPRDRVDFLSLALLCLMFVNMNFAAIFLWGAGSANYLWSVGLIVLFLLPYRFFWHQTLSQSHGTNSKNLFSWGTLIFAVPAGWASEYGGVLVSITLALSILYAYVRGTKLPIWYFLGFLAFFCGWVILYNSPGSASRSLIFLENGSFLSLRTIWEMSFLEKLKLINYSFNHSYSRGFSIFLGSFLCFYVYKMQIRLKPLHYFLALVGFILALIFTKHICALLVYAGILYLMWKMQEKLGGQYRIYILLFLLWTFIALILLQLKGSLPWRGRFLSELILIAMLVLMFRDVYLQSQFRKRIETLLSFSLAFSVLLCFANWAYVGYGWSQVKQIIQTQKAQGIKEIIVPKKYLKSFYSKDWDDLSQDPKFWTNSVYSQYFGIKSLSIQ